VLIRQLDAVSKIMDHATTAEQRELLMAQATMIYEASEESVPEPNDRDDVRHEYDLVLAAAARRAELGTAARESGH
jgi:phenylalanyl-tRNA synthetase beta subunit